MASELYLTAADLRDALPTQNNDDAHLIDIAIGGASRGVDSYTGQRFWVPDTATVRTYVPTSGRLAEIHPIADTAGLIVKTDPSGNGSFSTTLTITTDFLLLPLNAADEFPVAPYTQIWLPELTFPTSNRRPTLQVTAKFGWPAVPADVRAAALLLARDLFKELKDAPFGVAGTAEFGILRIRQNATARTLLARYVRPRVA